jgi:hypothetical protein
MSRAYEYLVLQSQEGKITFVNEEYTGRFTGDQVVTEVRERMFDSCPDFCEFLRKAGADGWDLVCGYSITNEYGRYEKLIFKRSK